MFENIDRRYVKAQSRAILRDAQVSPRAFFALYLGTVVLMELCGYLSSIPVGDHLLFSGPGELFITIFTTLLSPILGIGVYLYCISIRRGERAEFLVLFDGFSFAGKIIVLYLLQSLFIFLWALLFILPGIVAAYRYRFAYLNLCENPSLSASEALNLSKQQTQGYKFQLFQLDLSYYGWIVLSALPTILLAGLVIDPDQFNAIAANPLYILAELGCYFLVSLLYLPGYHTSEVAYYETAVRTSGVDARRYSPPDDEAPFF